MPTEFSDFSKENANKIYFTKNIKLNPNEATADDFSTSFEAGENIKAIVYLARNYGSVMGNLRVGLDINAPGAEDNLMGAAEMLETPHPNLPYYTFFLSYPADKYQAYNANSEYSQVSGSMMFLSALGPKTHTVTVKTSSSNISGSFQFDASNENVMSKLKSGANAIALKAKGEVGLPKAKMKKSSYSKELVSYFNSLGWTEKFSKAIITSSDWSFLKDPVTGEITGRTLSVVMVSKRGSDCMYQNFTVVQEKNGKNYGPFKRYGTGDQTHINCDKI